MTEFYVADTKFLCQIDKFRKILDAEGDDGNLYRMLYYKLKRKFYGKNNIPRLDVTPLVVVTQYIIKIG